MQPIIYEFEERFAEYLEMLGERSPEMLNRLLASEVARLRAENEFLKIQRRGEYAKIR